MHAAEERSAIVHKVQMQVQQQVGAKTQAVQTVEEGMETSRWQQVRKRKEAALPRDEDSGWAAVKKVGGCSGTEACSN